jgi:hypothetical protein
MVNRSPNDRAVPDDHMGGNPRGTETPFDPSSSDGAPPAVPPLRPLEVLSPADRAIPGYRPADDLIGAGGVRTEHAAPVFDPSMPVPQAGDGEQHMGVPGDALRALLGDPTSSSPAEEQQHLENALTQLDNLPDNEDHDTSGPATDDMYPVFDH